MNPFVPYSPVMAYPLITRILVLVVAFVCVPFVCCNTEKVGEYAAYAGADLEDMPDSTGAGGQQMPDPNGAGGQQMPDPNGAGGQQMPDPTGAGGQQMPDPAELIAKALLCFNDKYIYRSCEESCRLTQSGNLGVPPDYVDAYCSGPCLSETHLVLNCIDGIMQHFIFYNKATTEDVRETIQAGCGHGNERGDFDVSEHIESERGSAYRIMKPITMAFGFMIVGRAVWL